MRICFLNGTGLQYDRGSSNYLAYLLPVLATQGVEGHFFTPFASQNDIADSITSWYVPCDGSIDADTNIDYINKQVDIALTQDYDIIHIHSIPAALRIPEFKKKGIPVVVTHHGSGLYGLHHPEEGPRTIYESYLSKLHEADETIVHSKLIQSIWEQTYGIKTELFFLGVPIQEQEKPTLIEQPPYSLDAKNYFLFLGKLKDEKGPDIAIKAYAKSKSTFPLVIAGPPRFEEAYAESLRTIHHNGGRVIFTNTVAGQLKAELLSNALATLNPLKIAGLPLVVLESMGYGTPVISSESGLHHPAIRETILFPSEDIGALTEKLVEAVQNPAFMIEEGKRQQAFISEYHTIEALADRYLQVYDRVIENNKRITKKLA